MLYYFGTENVIKVFIISLALSNNRSVYKVILENEWTSSESMKQKIYADQFPGVSVSLVYNRLFIEKTFELKMNYFIYISKDG